MNQGSRTVLAVIFLAILVIAGVKLYPIIRDKKAARDARILSQKTAEIDDLIIHKQDCAKAIAVAADVLKSQPEAVEIWNFKGACEFQTGKREAARLSFEKVLSLDPYSESAKNYLTLIEESNRPGVVVVYQSETPLSRTEFESRLGFATAGILDFEKAVSRPASIPEYLMGTYSTAGKFNDAVSALKSELDKTGIKFTASETDNGTFLAAGDTHERKIIIVKKTTPIKVEINYQRLN